MSTVSLYLKDSTEADFINCNNAVRGNPDNTNVYSINVYFKCIDGKFRRYSKQEVRMCDWIKSDPGKKIFERLDPKVKGAKEVNFYLDDLTSRMNKFIRDKELAGEPIFKLDLEPFLPKKEVIKKIIEVEEPKSEDEKEEEIPDIQKSFLQFFKKYEDDKNFKKTLCHLNAFNDHYKYDLNWSKITDKFWKKYIKYCTEVYVNPTSKEVGILNSTLTRDPRCIRRVCKDARKIGIEVPHDCEDFKRPKTVKKGRRRAVITEERLFELLAFDFTNKELYSPRENLKKVIPNILKVRDEYTFRFYTGLRLSDAYKLLRDNVVDQFDGEGGIIRVIDFAQQKTLNANIVPLNDICLEILAKYEGSQFTALPRFCNQWYNRICKRMFKLAGFTRLITMTRMKGDKLIVETKEEWQVLTSHSARHSAATNLLDHGADLYDVKEFLGQESIKSTEVYAEMSRTKLNKKILKITNRDRSDLKKETA
jgi:site-specific recombinase XerD